MSELQLEFISHACLKLTGEFGTLVCDPWLVNEPVFNLSTWKFPPALHMPEEVVEDADYLLITHTHEDHFHAPSLDYFRRDIPVYLSAFDTHPGMRANTIEMVLRKMGFYNIHRLHHWETILLGGKTPLTCIPNADTRAHDWENMGFVLEHPDCVLLNLNDNVNDEALCKEIKIRFGHIDIGLIQTGGVTMFPGCFRMPEADMKVAAEARKLAFREQRRLLDFIEPSVIAPFAGDFAWLADQYFHNNWANRTTPILFRQMMAENYQNSELVLLQPGDVWGKAKGHVTKTRRIDWENMLDEIQSVKTIFKDKLAALENYLHDVDLSNLKNRSIEHTKRIEKHITRDYINFTARFRIQVEGKENTFSFVTKASPEAYFQVDWDDNEAVDQTLFVPEHIWAAIIEGKLMWNIIQWVGQAEQEKFTKDMGRMWFWMEYHIDLGNKNIQVNISENLFPQKGTYAEPQKATFPQRDEYKKIRDFYQCSDGE